jgi:hypothetical protein
MVNDYLFALYSSCIITGKQSTENKRQIQIQLERLSGRQVYRTNPEGLCADN